MAGKQSRYLQLLSLRVEPPLAGCDAGDPFTWHLLTKYSTTDEPRRSVRATKGQHTKTSDLLDQSSPTPTTGKKKITKKSSKKAAKKDDDEEVEIIRCVCGAIETSDEDTEPWIACDECECWQHNICVGISRFGDEAPEHYLCEKHDPSFPLHKELLDGLKKGRKVWEERRRKVEQEIADEEAEKAGHKKKSKKPQAKRASDLSEISHATNGKAKSPSVPVSEKKGSVARSGSTKRKIRDESHDTETKVPSDCSHTSTLNSNIASGTPSKNPQGL